MVTLLSRDRSAEYISERGIPMTPRALAQLASEGGGPRYSLIRRRAVYHPQDLDAWINSEFEKNARLSASA
jgi:hypothetical protein